VAGRTTKTEAVVLRSIRLGEADRVLHLYTLEHGRIGAVAKGIRRTKSRFGARLEPLSHVELMVHQGRGELGTVTGVQLIRPHHAARGEQYRLGVGLIGAEAMLRLYTEQESNARAFEAITRFLDLVDTLPTRAPARPALDPLALAFQLKLLWLSGYAPHLGDCAHCSRSVPLVAYGARAGGGVCADCADGALRISAGGFEAIEALLRRPLAEASGAVPSERAAREALGVITASYEFHGGFRLRTLSA
jgi:DNA repair protein RecO (recombination protein O)